MKYSIWCYLFGHIWKTEKDVFIKGNWYLESRPSIWCKRCGVLKTDVLT